MSAWQSEEQRCGVVLREVFGWLDGRSLARAGAACRTWRRAAAEPAHWRRLLRAAPGPAGALVSWRQEYVWSRAGWRLAAQHRAPDTLLHAALAPGDPALLALAGADASAAVWQREAGAWREAGRACLRERGWSAVARAHWAGRRRLLLAGPLALVADWELVVLRVEEDGRCGSVASRVRCSAGAAGCWADAAGDTFFSFELHRLGVGLYCTTVWLNSATQETESEYAGVTSPLLRIYNEDGAHLTHALVAEVPREPPGDYLRALAPARAPAAGRVLVTGAGAALSAWRVWAPRPPALHARAGGGLAERVRRRRESRGAPEPDEPEPDEAAVRAACAAPEHCARLAAPLVGLALHERGRCMWAVCSDGSAACVSVSALQVLARVAAPGGAPGAGVHYVQPAAAGALVAWPAGGYSGRVWWLAAATCARGEAALAHAGAAVCCVLVHDELLVLAGDELYVWRSRATPQWEPRDEDA
ncbi:hypothetical protein PYW07_000680 [Mythimna separata]|uniref:F-box domain-containing protein n=1 Tax=Mythimna separata TaxID=271217 RepID=A0AAD8DW19_MYTSE|nr:hypothetical protein PYW07_000680 [Mythimna separata]